MKRYVISILIILALPAMAYVAFGQAERRANQPAQRLNARERFQNMSEEEREKLRAEMRERAILRPGAFGREEQLKAIATIEEELAKLKAAVSEMPDFRNRPRDLSEEDRAKLREKFAGVIRDRQMAIRAIEQELSRLEAPGRLQAESRARVNELKEIHDLAVKENATQTADRIQKLITAYLSGPRDSGQRMGAGPRPDASGTPREKPVRPSRDSGQADAGRKAPPFTLQSFGGKTVNLSDYRGKIVVLEWLNLECPFSMYHHETANTMADLVRKYKSKDVVWLAVNSTSHTTPEANRQFIGKHELAFPILDDRSGAVGHAYGARTTPHMFIVNTAGNIVYDGAIDNSPMGKTPDGQKLVNYVDKALTELIAGGTVSIPNTKPYGCSVKYAN